MNEEKDNIGVNNIDTLPPMGTTLQDSNIQNQNNVQERYGLPPISNFTNFNNNYETPKVDNNISVFDLMDQFESVNQNSVNNAPVMNVEANNNQGSNNTNLNQQVPVQNQSVSSIPQVNINNNLANNTVPFSMFSGNNSLNESNSQNITNLNQNNENDSLQIFGGTINNNIDTVRNNVNQASSLNTVNTNNVQPSINAQANSSINNTESYINQVPTNNKVVSNQNINNNFLDVFGNNTSNNSEIVENVVKENNSFDVNSLNNQVVLNNNTGNNFFDYPTQNTNNVNDNVAKMSNDSLNSLQNITDNYNVNNETVSPVEEVIPVNDDTKLTSNDTDFSNFSFNTTSSNMVEIPTSSIDSIENNDSNNNLETNVDSDNKINDKKENLVDNANNTFADAKVKPKKKGHKLLFITLLVFTIVVVSLVGVLSYFMFVKTDKLVCGLQDYSNDNFILDETMAIRFKGNKMTKANLKQTLTYTDDHLDEKASLLEELKNQYQGLGFNVKFVDDEYGFEISMDFTKSELESWFGTKLKNSSKTQLKKDLRASGYTCK